MTATVTKLPRRKPKIERITVLDATGKHSAIQKPRRYTDGQRRRNERLQASIQGSA